MLLQLSGLIGWAQVYSEQIGNLMMDALSAKKYYHFVRLMGRAASHITLECALQTHPQAAIISEEVHQQGKTLADIVDEVRPTTLSRRTSSALSVGCARHSC